MTKIKENKAACVCKHRLQNNGGSCIKCYYSQVKDGKWTGSQRCWNAQCLLSDK